MNLIKNIVDKFNFLANYNPSVGGTFNPHKLASYIDNNLIEGYSLVPISRLDEVGLNRLMSHFNPGFVAVNAHLTGNTKEENKTNTKELKNMIKKYGYGYIPVIGGWKEPSTGEISTEETFIIPPKSTNDLDTIFELGKTACKKFNQHSFLYCVGKENNEIDARWYDGDGNPTDDPDFKSVTLNDLKQQYFTAINKSKESPSFKEKTPKQFTLLANNVVELYIRSYPPTLNEHRSRNEFNNEIFVFNKKEWLELL
jgi:hypothetical protein